MNHYSWWKTTFIFGAIVLLSLYAVPNLYNEDPVVQVAHESGATKAETADQIDRLLGKADIPYLHIEPHRDPTRGLLVRFQHSDDQRRARELLDQELGKDYVVALNTAIAMPEWLHEINAKPINLGLDLKGGVYFLLAVDTDSIHKRELENYQVTLRTDLREATMPYRKISVFDRKLIIEMDNAEDRAAVSGFIDERFPGAFVPNTYPNTPNTCLLYTSDAADE